MTQTSLCKLAGSKGVSYCALHALKQAGAAVALDLLALDLPAASGTLSPYIPSPLSPLPSPLLFLSPQPLRLL